MQFKDIVLLLAAAGSAVTALPAPEAEAQDAPVRRAEQAEQGEQAKQGKQGEQWVNPNLNGLYPGGSLGFQNLQNIQNWDPRFDPRFQDPRLAQFGTNQFGGGNPFFGNFKRDVEAEYNPLARRAEQAEAAKQGKQFLPGLGNNGFGNQWGQNGLGTNGIVAGGGGGGIVLGGDNGFGNNGFGNNGFFPGNRFNQLNRFPQFGNNQFGNQFGNNPFDFFN